MSAKTTEFNVTPSLQFVGHGPLRAFCGTRAKTRQGSCGVSVTLKSYRNTAVCGRTDRKSTRLNSSHVAISYAVFCLKKKKRCTRRTGRVPRTALEMKDSLGRSYDHE